MTIPFSLVSTLWTSNLATDTTTYSGLMATTYTNLGNFGTSTGTTLTNAQNMLVVIDIIRAYCGQIIDHDEAKLFHETATKMLATLPLGGGGQPGNTIPYQSGGPNATFTTALQTSLATHAQNAALRHFANHVKPKLL